MVTTLPDLSSTLRGIARSWSEARSETILAMLPDPASVGVPWSLAELTDLLQTGDAEPLLRWLTRLGDQARRQGAGAEQVGQLLSGIAAAVIRLAVETVSPPGDLGTLAALAAPLQAAGLNGYLQAAGRTSAAPGGDLADRVARLEALQRVSRAANTSLHLTAMLDQVVEAVAAVIGSDTCSIWTYHEASDELWLRSARGLNPEAIGNVHLRIGQAITGEAARIRQPIKARDARNHSAYEYIAALGEGKFRSQVSVPIIRYSVDRLVGVITLKSIEYRDFGPDEMSFLRTVAGELAIAIENARLYQQTDARLRETVKELHALQHVSARVAEKRDLGEVLETIAVGAHELSRAQRVEIVQIDSDQDGWQVMASYGEEGPLSPVRRRVQHKLINEVVHLAEVKRVIHRGEPSGGTPGEIGSGGDGFSLFAVPLRTAQGVIGALCLHYDAPNGREHDSDDNEHRHLMISFAHAAAIAIENARLHEETRRNLILKSALLKEMHHRVGNNLEVVGGLLKMQIRRMKESNWALNDCLSRIQSMAAVHELLSKEEVDVTTVAEIAKLVVKEIDAGFTPPGCHYRFTVDGPPIEVSSRQATLLAIVINEIVVNAVRHGLAGRTAGEINITLRVDAGQVVLSIADDGCGLPAGLDLEKAKGLGLSLLRTLVGTDLGGQLVMTNQPDGGAIVTVTFPFRVRSGGGMPADG